MCLYHGRKIMLPGYFVANDMYYLSQNIKIDVLENGGPPLLDLKLKKKKKFKIYFFTTNNNVICQIKKIKEVQRLLKQDPDVWKDELGCFKKFGVQLNLKENATPKFFQPRTVKVLHRANVRGV